VSSLIFGILTQTRAGGLPYLVDGAFWLISVGLTGALVAAVFGVLGPVPDEHPGQACQEHAEGHSGSPAGPGGRPPARAARRSVRLAAPAYST
jgi:hypothetical protein